MHLNKLSKHIGIIDQFVVSGFRYLIFVLAVKSLTVEDFGLYILLFLSYTISSSIQIPLIINPLYQLYSRKKNTYLSFFKYMQYINLCYSLISSLAVFMYSFQLFEFSVALALTMYNFVFLQYEFLRKKNTLLSSDSSNLFMDLILYMLIVICILLMTLNESFELIHLFLIPMVTCLTCVLIFDSSLSFVSWKRMRVYIREVKPIALSFLIITILNLVSGNIYVYFLNAFVDLKTLGVFNAIKNLVGPLSVVIMTIENLILRDLIKLKNSTNNAISNGDYEGALKYYKQFFLFFILFSVLFQELVVSFVLTEEYLYLSYLFPMFSILLYTQLLSKKYVLKFRVEEKYKYLRQANVYASILTPVYTSFLIFYCGVDGAFLSLLVYQMTLYFSYKYYDAR